MVILDEKLENMLSPPPAYTDTLNSASLSALSGSSRLATDGQSSVSRRVRKTTLTTLPSYILLHIIYQTLPQSDGKFYGESKDERQRKVLYWMSISLRLVNRALYIGTCIFIIKNVALLSLYIISACMHILRSTYLPAYSSIIRTPYTSDPFPLIAISEDNGIMPSPINAIHRETQVLDYFLALKVREDVWADDTELHLERDESFRDLFDLMQPRSRLEDLIRIYGAEAGIVTSSTSSTDRKDHIGARTIPFSRLSASFSSRRVGLILNTEGTKRTIIEVPRQKDEALEIAAHQIIVKLKAWLQL